MNNVEVYKTDLDDRSKAIEILEEIRRAYPGCDPSFDLEDCDRVLRIEKPASGIDERRIQNILNTYGYEMNELPT
ncbi:MAG TPA: hypothetical protein VJ964_04610 [Balneolaceae bacterium]|nr:hypothetical protein [Balneolaceae bacterium]